MVGPGATVLSVIRSVRRGFQSFAIMQAPDRAPWAENGANTLALECVLTATLYKPDTSV
jgi:hypothetical protein